MPDTDKSTLDQITAEELQKFIDLGKPIQNIEIPELVCIKSSNRRTLDFYNCKFHKLEIQLDLGKLTISNCDFEEIDIKGNIRDLCLLNIASNRTIIRVNNAIVQKIHLDNCPLIDKFILGDIGTVEIGELFCFKSNINDLALFGTIKKVFLNLGNQIRTSTFNGEFNDVEIVNKGLPDQKLSPNKFENIFYLNKSEKSRLNIQNSSITNFHAIGQHADTYIELSEVKCENVTFAEDFGENGKIKIKTCNELSKVSFTSANISSLEIFNSDFSKTCFVSGQSIIENIRWQSVEWPEKLEYYTDPKVNASFRRETLRNLKLNAHTQQDTINYIKFHSLELQAYEIQIETKKWCNGDRILLWLNKISNNHGLSWERGVWFSLGVGALFFIPNLFLLNNSYWEFGWSNLSDFCEVAGTTTRLFSQSLYAAHSFDYLNQYNPKGIVFLIDLIGRIFLTYGYYQTIVAFRKFGKK